MVHDYDEIVLALNAERVESVDMDEEAMNDVAFTEERIVVGEEEFQPIRGPDETVAPLPVANPLPLLSMVVLSIVMLSEFLSANVSAPFILFMVKDFAVEDASFWSGILVSTFFLSQFSSSMFWTALAGQTSPRFVLIVTLLGSAFSTLIFGCSKSLEIAMLSRLAQGIFGGGIGVARGSVTAIADASNEGKAWGILGFCWGMGGIAGAVIGGAFERPATKWPSHVLFSNALFVEFPYLLPCTIASLIVSAGGVLACFVAPDVGPRRKVQVSFDTEKPTPSLSHLLTVNETNFASRISSLRSIKPRPIPKKVSQLFNNAINTAPDSQTPLLSSSFGGYSAVATNDARGETMSIVSIPRSRPCSKTRFAGPRSFNHIPTGVDCTEDDTNHRGRGQTRNIHVHRPTSKAPSILSTVPVERFFPRTDTLDSVAEPAVPLPVPLPPIPEAQMKEAGRGEVAKLPMALIVQYGLLALHTTTHDQIFLSYFVSPYEEGGVGLGAGDFAQLIALMCIFQLFYQFYVYTKIGPPKGPFTHLALFRTSCVLFIVSYLSVALYRGMFSGGNLMLALIGSTAIRYCGITFAFTAIAILINSMTPPASVGYANGIAQSIASLARCVGPVVGGSVSGSSIFFTN
ncbi:hypothetical protein V5O48_011225 [Marasmius crinis-equi]|uniref:Uncharacterized protein n=1 Tax=Marasmius crinis-equi TaxID=585013 RepID=A0ABR3F658_9AGAR